jgi:hypothetical protein
MLTSKPKIGDSKKKENKVIVVEELFTADSIKWVRCSRFRKKGQVGFMGRKYSYIDEENIYMTELEWIRSTI